MRNIQPPASHRSAAHLRHCRRARVHHLLNLVEDVEVGVERRHDVARVRLEADVRQAGHGAGRLRLGEEAWLGLGLGFGFGFG